MREIEIFSGIIYMHHKAIADLELKTLQYRWMIEEYVTYVFFVTNPSFCTSLQQPLIIRTEGRKADNSC